MSLKEIRTEDAIGQVLGHDITQIVPGVYKGARFLKGHIIQEEDIEVLKTLGKEHIFVWEQDGTTYHENEAAEMLLDLSISSHLLASEPREGKIELTAAADGLLKINRKKLRAVNQAGNMMIASRHGDTPVRAGEKIAGMRIIPLVIDRQEMDSAVQKAQDVSEEPIFTILPWQIRKAAVLVTGNEVYSGRIQDAFTPRLKEKLAEYGVEIVEEAVLPDDPGQLCARILEAKKKGAELILCTGGMSVDPDDRTPLAIRKTGARIISYGAPVLPGAMFLLSYLDDVPVCGLPGCVMYAKRTVFDLLLPRLLAKDPISEEELADLGEGGLCLGCAVCTWPNCGFGKGHA